jgi:hypothetical protein
MAQLQKDKKMAIIMTLELLLPFFVDLDEDRKRLLTSELVFDLTDVKDMDELVLDNGDKR